MQIICVLYDESNNKVLVNNNGNDVNLVSVECEKDNNYFSILQTHLLNTFKIKVIESELSTLFKSTECIVFLHSVDSNELENYNWVELKILKKVKGINKIALSQILNYYLRMNLIEMESLKFSIRCENENIVDECIKLINRNNPGILVVENKKEAISINSPYRITLIKDLEVESNESIKEIALITNDDKESKNTATNVIDIRNLYIEGIYKEVMRLVAELYQTTVIENAVYTSCSFYGVTGMTESGKSYYANHLDISYNMWNLKIRTFIENAKYLYDDSISTLLEVMSIQLMLEFSIYHYFKHSMVIESIYSERIHNLISNLFKDKYKLIYVDVNEDERKNRSLDSLSQLEKKDIKKKKLGIDKLMNIADFKLDNSKSIEYSNTQLERYLRS